MIDAAVIGAGPIGLEMAAGLKSAGLSFVQIERGVLGETIFHYPPNTRFFSSPERIAIAGVPLITLDQSKATREEYLAYLRAVVTQLGLAPRLCENLDAVEKQQEGFLLRTSHTLSGAKSEYRARNLILATGDMHRPRLIGAPGEDLPHVSHFLADPHIYFQQRVLIVGGRNSAAEAAIRLYRAGARVTLSCRNAELPEKSIKYWIYPELMSLIKTGAITFHPGTTVRSISSEHVLLNGIGDTHIIEADRVLLLTGYSIDPRLYEGCGIRMDPETHKPHWNPETMESNVPGIFICGTGAAGTQSNYRFFIENCHEHVDRILTKLTGKKTEAFRKFFEMPES